MWEAARSTRRPPWDGAHVSAGGAGTFRGKSTHCPLCRSPSARPNTKCGIAFGAIPRATWRRGAWSPSRGPGNGADGLVCRTVLRVASTKQEKSPLCGLMAGAPWTATRVSGHGTRTNSACPHCVAHEAEVHVLWDCPELEQARGAWRLWLGDAAAAIPQLGPPDQWLGCLQRASLFPLRLAQGVDPELLDEFLYRLYGMYLAFLAARMAASCGDQAGHGDSLFLDLLRPRPRNPFHCD